MRRHRSKLAVAITASALVAAGSLSTTSAHADAAGPDRVTAAERAKVRQLKLDAGLQIARKHRTLPQVQVDGRLVEQANPYTSLVADPARVDWSYWDRVVAQRSARQAAASGQRSLPPAAVTYDELEPDDRSGANDVRANAERIKGVGADRSKRAVRILGSLAESQLDATAITTTEDQGAIPIATETGIGADTEAATTASEIGDGPYGSGAADTGDFDFFHLTGDAGKVLRASTAGSDFDTVLVVYDAEGEIVASNDDANGTLQSEIGFPLEAGGDYYLMVSGFGPLPADPFDSSSGTGAGSEGSYELSVSVGDVDTDYYAVYLKPGDVVGGTVSGGAERIDVTKFDGSPRIGSQQDASYIYPAETVLPGGGNAAMAYVAEEAGWYAFSTGGLDGSGDYQMQLEFHRPGSETAGEGVTQTIFLDFDGERLNTGIFGGGGVGTLSPLSSFLGYWDLTRADQNRLINRIVRTVEENVEADLIERGLNDELSIQVLNSRDHPDPFGRNNVSRVIVGGTIAEARYNTIGVAQSIDPGNYGHEETALVLLDILSGDPDEYGDASLNYYLEAESNRIRFIGTAIGNVTSHEIGHYVGSFHVDQYNDTLNLMDQGGNFPLLYGVGDDGVGGTADDPDVDFGVDTYNPFEGFDGLEDTLDNSAWAFVFGS